MTQTVLLGDIATIHDKRRVPLNSRQRAERQGDIPYYGATGILDYVDKPLFEGEYVLIGEDGENLRSKKSDLAFKVSGKFWVNNHAHILQGNESWINDYIVSVFRALDIAPYITGAAQPKLNQAALMRIPIYWPGKENAKKIADILGTIDEKIELNRKMNKTLEQLGQALFRHYFIDNPEAEKWEKESIYEFANVVYGAPFKSKLFNETREGKPLIRIRDLKTQKPGFWTTEQHPKGTLIKPGDIVVGMDAEFRPVVWASDESWMNQRVCQFVPKENINHAFLLEAIKPWLDFFERGKIGTTVIHLGKADIDTFKIKKPDAFTMSAFANVATPIYDLRVKNSLEIQTLTTLRDTLLPRLINGKVKV